MKVCTFVNDQGQERVGFLKGDKISEVPDCRDMLQFIHEFGPDILKKLQNLPAASGAYNIGEVKFLPPVTRPEKLIFVGLNYCEHARETNTPIPEHPVLFSKYRNALAGHGDNVVITRETKKCDYEAELAFVIGKRAKNVKPEDAMEYVFGYTICNDVSARDLQKRVSQWLMGKTPDTFAPMGPFISTSDEIQDPHNLKIMCRVNGEVKQNSNTSELIFNVPYLLSYISKAVTLEPGDIISTGTPSGVAMGMEAPVWLKDGDVCEVQIEGLGILRNTFVREKEE